MELNGVIVYFPWGSGGNFIRNVITLDPRFCFFDNQKFTGVYPTANKRFKWLAGYYSKKVNARSWLSREWSIRRPLYVHFYDQNLITWWDPSRLLAYDCHGNTHEVDWIMQNPKLTHFDRYRIDNGTIEEAISPWGLAELTHIFLVPESVDFITKVYISKNPDLNNLPEPHFEDPQAQTLSVCSMQVQNLRRLIDFLKAQQQKVFVYTAENLFRGTGRNIAHDIVKNLDLQIPLPYIRALHKLWLHQTREVYYNSHNQDLNT